MADIRQIPLEQGIFDVVILYGVLHCLADESELADVVERVQRATKPAGYNIVCAFNSRRQELSAAHPTFAPCLREHEQLLALYDSWKIETASDSDLHEAHPNNGIWHTHSMTRFIATRPEDS